MAKAAMEEIVIDQSNSEEVEVKKSSSILSIAKEYGPSLVSVVSLLIAFGSVFANYRVMQKDLSKAQMELEKNGIKIEKLNVDVVTVKLHLEQIRDYKLGEKLSDIDKKIAEIAGEIGILKERTK